MSTDTLSNNKRIAKNTMYLYIRMFLTMAVSIFASRVVLDALGAENYGIYDIVGGVVVLFSFLSSSLNDATQRFLSFSLGENDSEETGRLFSMSLNVYAILSVVVLVLAETVGLWFVNTKLNIPEERADAAFWVYQLSIFTFILGLLRVPYNASVLAYERMDFYAYSGLAEVVLKLVTVYLIYVSAFDKLVVFAGLQAVVVVSISALYYVYCVRAFNTCNYQCVWHKEIFKKLFSFTGWSLFGSMATMSAQQGLNILLNIFYGVTVNAAVGIANQVSSAVYQFVSNFQGAFRPQIIKYYAAKDYHHFYALIMKGSKFSYFMMYILVLPIMFQIDKLLSVWLVEVPEYTNIFCQLILSTMCIEALAAPLWMSVQAIGKIKNYQILISCVIFLNIPLAYIVLKFGMPAYSVLIVKLLVTSLVFVTRCWYIQKYISFPLPLYLKKVMMPVFVVTIAAVPLPWIANNLVDNFWLSLIGVSFVALLSSTLFIYLIGIDTNERDMILGFVKKKLQKSK